MNSSTTNLVLTPDTAIDLHLHTTYSDGTWTPGQLLDYLAREQFGLAAIADHDRADTVAALQQLALDKHQPILVAAEMTTLWNDEMSGKDELSGQDNMTDLLCFGFDPPPSALNDIARDLFRRQCENTREVYENLGRKSFTFQEEPDPWRPSWNDPVRTSPLRWPTSYKNTATAPANLQWEKSSWRRAVRLSLTIWPQWWRQPTAAGPPA